MSKQAKVYGNCTTDIKPIELFKTKVQEVKGEGGNKITIAKNDSIGDLDISWLISAAKSYHISPNIEDYIIFPNPIITTHIPNRNNQAFGLKALLEFDEQTRRPRYKTFVGTPTHVEHQNQDITKAKGVNLDSTIVSVPKYGVAKIIVLSAFDRTKDPELVTRMMNNKTNSFSMGAMTPSFQCSLCSGLLGPGVRRTCTCSNLNYTDLASYGKIVKGKLSYIIAKEPTFFENSVVESPADFTADTDYRL